MSEPICVAVGLLVKNGCVLMGERRPDKIYPLHWEFPGGKLELGEKAIDAVARELREELDIQIEDAEKWHSEMATYSNGITYDICFYLIRQWHGEIVNREFHRIDWISPEVLPKLQHLSGNKDVIARLVSEGIPV